MNMHNIAPVFQVADIEAALKHHKEVLFSEDFRVALITLRGREAR